MMIIIIIMIIIRSNPDVFFNHTNDLRKFRDEYKNYKWTYPYSSNITSDYIWPPVKINKKIKYTNNTRIRIGYLSASIKSKALAFLIQDLIRFHDRSRFEIHLFSTTGPDRDDFMKYTMKGVDWRKKIIDSAEYYHDCSGMREAEVARLIYSKKIAILCNWDGYAHNGVRMAKIFPLQSAPIQVNFQEYLGSLGADHIQYIVTDKIVSPVTSERAHVEKFIWVPPCFFVNSMAYQQSFGLHHPTLELDEDDNPQVNLCSTEAARRPLLTKSNAFVYCNFNKHLKFSPQVFDKWLEALDETTNEDNDSYLCLLEYPRDSVDNILTYVKRTNKGKWKHLKDKIRFLPFIGNPYEHQKRLVQQCSAFLDSTVYNSHTTAVDALWGAVPLVTLLEAKDMSARVGASMLHTLGIPELVATDIDSYKEISVKLASNKTFFDDIRSRLVAAADSTKDPNQRNNPLWDMARYVHYLEKGWEEAWHNHILGYPTKHVDVKE